MYVILALQFTVSSKKIDKVITIIGVLISNNFFYYVYCGAIAIGFLVFLVMVPKFKYNFNQHFFFSVSAFFGELIKEYNTNS